jgi:hypothetical protein
MSARSAFLSEKASEAEGKRIEAMQPAVARLVETAPVSWWETCLDYVNLSLRRGAKNCQGKQIRIKRRRNPML